jgi:WD40 repeat protein
MNPEQPRRAATVPLPVPQSHQNPPPAPPLPPQQRARNALNRFLGFPARAADVDGDGRDGNGSGLKDVQRLPSLSAYNASASHKTGLEINSLSINDEGSHAILAGRDILKTIRVDEGSCTEDINIRAAIRNYNAHTSGRSKDNINISDVAWGKGNYGNYIAAANANGPITLYDLNHPGIEVAQLKEHRRQIHRVTFNPHAGQHFLSASQDGTVRLWDLRDVRRDANTFPSRFTTSGQNEGVRDVKWSPTDIFELAMCTDGGFVQRWDTRKLKSPLTRIAAHTGPCATIDWHPDGKHLLSASSDKTVKVWNISAEGRRHKAVYEIKTPYPLRHARWRPPCQSSWPSNRATRQCTQIVTSYERDHPIVHIWDFRRPWLPFREMEGYQTAPTDLLWHSQDLLWTVNREGMFLQHDIKYARKVMDKRNMQAFAVSPLGEFSLVTQKRATRLRPGLNRDDSEAFIRQRRSGLSPSEIVGQGHSSSRGSHDDTIDDTFLSSSYGKRHTRSPSARIGKSFNDSPPAYDVGPTGTVSLEDVLRAGRAYKPGQSAARGRLPGSPNLLLLQYFSKQYRTRVLPEPPSVDAFLKVHEVFEHNAIHAQKASLYRLAQSWRMMGRAVMTELLNRANHHRALRAKNDSGPRKSLLDESPFARRTRRWLGSTERRLSSKPGTPLSRPLRTMESLSTVQPDSTSNVPTPIARPVKDRHESERAPLKEIDTDESLTLPPSLLTPSEIQENLEGQNRATLQVVDHREIEHRNSWYGSVQKYHERREAINNWRQPLKEPLNLEDGHSERPKATRYNSDESFGMFPSLSSRDASGPASSVASRSDLMEAVQENLRSDESYSSLDLGSSSSSEPILGRSYQPSQSKSEEQSTGSVLVSSSESDHEGPAVITAPTENKDAPARDIPRDMQTLALNNQQSFTSDNDTFAERRKLSDDLENMEASGTIIPHRHSRQLGRSRDVSISRPTTLSHAAESAPAVMPSKNASVDSTKSPFITADFLASDYNIDAEKDKPFRVINMLNHLLDYHTVKVPDAQTATNFIFMLTPLLPETHALPQPTVDATITVYSEYFTAMGYSDMEIYSLFSTSFEHLIKAGLQPLQAESIISTYHSQLQHLGLFSQAAYLRRVSYPMYPSVYEGGLKDTQVSFMCGTCRKPINTPNKMRCENCTQRQDPCPICWCDTSPFEGPAKIKTRAGANRSSVAEPFIHPARTGNDSDDEIPDIEAVAVQKNTLYSTCLLCNHSAHAACLRTWHSPPPSYIDVSPSSVSTSEGACPTPGCLCACTPGPRRNELMDTVERKEREKSVRDDDWVVAESRAAQTAATLAGGRKKSGLSVTTPSEEVGSGRRERRSVGFRKG